MNEEMEQLIDPNEVGQGKKSIVFTISIILLWLLLLFFAFQAVTGYLNLHRVYEGEKPYFLMKTEEKVKQNKLVRTYHFGLYKIIYTETESATQTFLRPFFYDEKEAFK